jgi:hypothetical protein
MKELVPYVSRNIKYTLECLLIKITNFLSIVQIQSSKLELNKKKTLFLLAIAKSLQFCTDHVMDNFVSISQCENAKYMQEFRKF